MLKSVKKPVNRLLGERSTKRTGCELKTVSEETETDRAGGGLIKYLRRLRDSHGHATSTNGQNVHVEGLQGSFTLILPLVFFVWP